MNQIRVGPESAGSEPGPACYGRGGEKPAVTDADLLLGRLDAERFAGGEIRLEPQASVAALQREIGQRLELDPEVAAIGICEVVDESMANAARVHAVENGKELADFTMIAFGGAAPLHASRLCEKLDIARLLIPPGAGVGSAIGFLRAPFGFEAVRGAFLRLSEFDADWTNRLIGELDAEAQRFAQAGGPGLELQREIKAYMRYQGQGWEIVVPLPDRDFVAGDADEMRRRFEDEYRRLFGRALDGLDIEIMTWSVQVHSRLDASRPVAPVDSEQPRSSSETRRIFDAREQRFVDAAVHHRDELAPGDRIDGPAVIIERETSTIVTCRYRAIRQPDGCLLLKRKEEDQ